MTPTKSILSAFTMADNIAAHVATEAHESIMTHCTDTEYEGKIEIPAGDLGTIVSITPHCSKSSNTSIIKSEGVIHTITNDITAPQIEIPVGDLKTIDIAPITSQCSMNIKSEHVEIVTHTTTNDIFDTEIGYVAEDECTTTSKKILPGEEGASHICGH